MTPGSLTAAAARGEAHLLEAFFCRAWRLVLLLGLTAYVLLKGFVPAWSAIDSDFPGYYTAARIVREGRDTSGLYDDAWFAQQVRDYGVAAGGKFAPFPPPTALLLVPVARLAPLAALRIVTLVSVLCLLASIILIARTFGWSRIDAALFTLSSGAALLSCLRFGQPYIIVSTLCLLGYYLYLKNRPWLAGMCLGLFVPIKYYPVIVIAVLAWRRQWAVLGGAVLVMVGVTLASIGALGWKVHAIFVQSIFGSHLIGHLSLRDQGPPLSAYYQSLDTLFARLFVLDQARNPHPLLAAPLLAVWSVILSKAVIGLATLATLVRLARSGTASVVAPSIALLGIVVLLIAPATATYTCVLLWLPVALLLDQFLAVHDRFAAYVILGLYVSIGFIPYGHTYPFEGRGGLGVLAYPRLLLLLAMFISSVCFLVRTAGRDSQRIGVTSAAAQE